MVDPIGATSLAFCLLGQCVKGFITVRTAQKIGKDGLALVRMLDMEEIRLMTWAQRASLLDRGKLDERLNVALIESILTQLSQGFSDTTKLKERYGLQLVSNPPESQILEQKSLAQAISAISLQGSSGLTISDEARADILLRAEIIKDKSSFPKRLFWAAWDKPKLQNFIAKVHDLVQDLWEAMDSSRLDELSKDVDRTISHIVRVEEKIDQLLAISSAVDFTSLNGRAITDQADSTSSESALGAAAHLKASRNRIGHDRDNGSAGFGQPSQAVPSVDTFSKVELADEQKIAGNSSIVTAKFRDSNVVVEWKELHEGSKAKILPRVQNLAYLLSTTTHPAFCSLKCIGLVEEEFQIGFVFERPPGSHDSKPISLLDCLSGRYGLPSASTRLKLALKVIKVIQILHVAGWWHKDLRSENILFFPRCEEARLISDPPIFDDLLLEPFLVGFSFAREASASAASEQPSHEVNHDIYRHPEALGQPSRSFDEEKDIYVLGMVLVEIAEWLPLRSILKAYKVIDFKQEVRLDQLAKIQAFMLQEGKDSIARRVAFRLGQSYLDLVMLCLSAPSAFIPRDWQRSDIRPRSERFEEAVRKLENCRL